MQEDTDVSRNWAKDEISARSEGGPIESSKGEMKAENTVKMKSNESVGTYFFIV